MHKRGRLRPSTLRYFIPSWFILGVCVIPHGAGFVAWDRCLSVRMAGTQAFMLALPLD